MTTQIAVLLAPLAAEAEKGAGAKPFIVGGGVLLILLILLALMLTFGKGREHS